MKYRRTYWNEHVGRMHESRLPRIVGDKIPVKQKEEEVNLIILAIEINSLILWYQLLTLCMFSKCSEWPRPEVYVFVNKIDNMLDEISF